MSWLFGDYLQALLEKKEWTPSKLAKKAGLSHVYMSQLLRGVKTEGNKHTRVSIDTVTALAKALEVPEQHLMLAYKGIHPDLIGYNKPLEGSLHSEIHASALKAGIDLFTLLPETRSKIEKDSIRKMHKLMDLLVHDELEQLGLIRKRDTE